MNPPLTCEIALQSSRSNSVDNVSVLIKPSLSGTRVFDYRKPRTTQYTIG